MRNHLSQSHRCRVLRQQQLLGRLVLTLLLKVWRRKISHHLIQSKLSWKRRDRFLRCTSTTTTLFSKKTRRVSTTSILTWERWLTSLTRRLRMHIWLCKRLRKLSRLQWVWISSRRTKERSRRHLKPTLLRRITQRFNQPQVKSSKSILFKCQWLLSQLPKPSLTNLQQSKRCWSTTKISLSASSPLCRLRPQLTLVSVQTQIWTFWDHLSIKKALKTSSSAKRLNPQRKKSERSKNVYSVWKWSCN